NDRGVRDVVTVRYVSVGYAHYIVGRSNRDHKTTPYNEIQDGE
ncbi:unnamed protein product, partial [Amoebophrya sp. A25]